MRNRVGDGIPALKDDAIEEDVQNSVSCAKVSLLDAMANDTEL
jgi:hypothetical protein